MAIAITCPGCGKSAHVEDSRAGKRLKCRCGASFEVPRPAPAPGELELDFADEDAPRDVWEGFDPDAIPDRPPSEIPVPPGDAPPGAPPRESAQQRARARARARGQKAGPSDVKRLTEDELQARRKQQFREALWFGVRTWMLRLVIVAIAGGTVYGLIWAVGQAMETIESGAKTGAQVAPLIQPGRGLAEVDRRRSEAIDFMDPTVRLDPALRREDPPRFTLDRVGSRVEDDPKALIGMKRRRFEVTVTIRSPDGFRTPFEATSLWLRAGGAEIEAVSFIVASQSAWHPPSEASPRFCAGFWSRDMIRLEPLDEGDEPVVLDGFGAVSEDQPPSLSLTLDFFIAEHEVVAEMTLFQR